MMDRSLGYVMGRASRFIDDVDASFLPTAMLQEADEGSA
jgi:hypothetical protein